MKGSVWGWAFSSNGGEKTMHINFYNFVKRCVGRPRHRRRNNIKMNVTERGCYDVMMMEVAQNCSPTFEF
jgi:hypothetical protein